jgi:hypothetical protein
MDVIRGRSAEEKLEQRGDTFTGMVWGDPLLRSQTAGQPHRAQHATMPPRPPASRRKQRTATTPVTRNNTLTLAE